MSSFWQDLRYAARGLLRQPRFSLPAIATLSIAIGGTAAIFTLVDRLVLSPLPFDEAERLVFVWEANPERGWDTFAVAQAKLRDWSEQSRTLEHIAALNLTEFNLATDGEAQHVAGAYVSASFLPALRVEPSLGRNFLLREQEPGAPAVALISQGLWLRRFGGSPTVLGKTVTIDSEPVTVVGVAPIDARFPAIRPDVWRPLPIRPDAPRSSHNLVAIARLADGATLEGARAEMATIAGRLATAYPDTDKGWTVRVVPIEEEFSASLRPALLLLLGVVGFVLLIACANIANLLLGRAAARRREIAIRAALGADRARLVRQLLVESALLALVSGALGVLFSVWGLGLLMAGIGRSLDSLILSEAGLVQTVRLDGLVLAFALAVALASALVFGLVPALRASRLDLASSLKEGERVTGDRRGHRLRSQLTTVQVSLAILLLAGEGLALRSLLALQSVDAGFVPDHVVALDLHLARARYPERHQRSEFFRSLIAEIRALPSVDAAATASNLPLATSIVLAYSLDGQAPRDPSELDTAFVRLVSPDYLRVLRVPLLRGRFFDESDREDANPVVVINQVMARQWPAGDPLGKRMSVYLGQGEPREVVGVVADVRNGGLESEARPELYLPYDQVIWGGSSPNDPLLRRSVIVRTRGDPLDIVPEVRRYLQRVDPGLALARVQRMTAVVARALSLSTWLAAVMGGFAGVALLLAAVGIYSVVFQSVAERRRDIGIRLALGARAADIARLTLRRTLLPVALGIAIGVPAAFGLHRIMRSQLYQVSSLDPLAIFGATGVFVLAALLGSALPVARATRIPPTEVLRSE